MSGIAGEYTLSSSELSFTFKGEDIIASSQTTKIKVYDDIVSRYFIPLAIAIALMAAGRIVLGLTKKGRE
jgi:phage gp36-like protein